MGAVLSVQHLAVLPPSFFNVLAQRTLSLLSFSRTSVDRQMRGFESADLTLLQSDDEALAKQVNLRHFARNQGAVERKLPVASIESFNSIPEQNLFALAAVKAGVAGRQAQRDLACLLNGQAKRVTPARHEKLADKLGELASLPKTRIRMPGGAQHLLADPIDSILRQTLELNRGVIEVGLCAYAPKGADLSFPNVPGTRIDREDALRSGGMIATYVQRDLIEGQQAVSVALSFSQLTASRERGIEICAEAGQSRFLPQTELTTRSGAHYIVSNSPDSMAFAIRQGSDKFRIFYDAGPQRAFM